MSCYQVELTLKAKYNSFGGNWLAVIPLKSTDVKPGLPPIEDRDLKNPEYKADPTFVPTEGLLVTKLAETVVLSEPSTNEVKNAGPETLSSFGPTSLPPTTTTTTLPPTTTSTTTRRRAK